MNVAYNMDCLAAMREMPDNAFDLAVVDPPYGDAITESCSQFLNVERERERERESRTQPLRCHGGDRWNRYSMESLRSAVRQIQESGQSTTCTARNGRERERDSVARTGGTWAEKYGKKIIAWDVAPGQEYFDELFRVSRNQIIWGGNYFRLPPTRCFLVWRKLSISESFSMAMCEYAWTSFNGNAKLFEHVPQGKPGDRFHPTQKPIALYSWIYNLFAKQGMKILDTHLGSGSSRIAAHEAGLDFVGYEIDKTYFDLQERRFEQYAQQQNMFSMPTNDEQNKNAVSEQLCLEGM